MDLVGKIKLTQGKSAIIDNDMADILSQHHWYVQKTQNKGRCYASTQISFGESWKNRTRVQMHHVIMGYPINKMEIDHKNGNGLDNRRSNLRIITRRLNCLNRKIHQGKFPGVYPTENLWAARITVDDKDVYLGTYQTRKKAYAAYLDGMKKYDPLSYSILADYEKLKGEK